MNILVILHPWLSGTVHGCMLQAAKNTLLLGLLLFTCGSLTVHAQDSSVTAGESLTINMGDSLAVSVYNEADLTVKVRIDSSGVVNFPLIGAIKVVGMSPKELSTLLEQHYLDGFLVEPLVTVTIEKYRPFYIHGQVKSPGVYEFNQDISVNQAIAIAGGLTERASASNWFIARGSEKQPLKVDASTRVLPGDIITINASFF